MLEDRKIIEIGEEPAVRFCGWLFAMNGAVVTRLAQNDKKTPRSDSWSDTYLNTQKTLSDPRSLSKKAYEQLVTDSDIVIADPDIDWTPFSGVRAITGTVDPFAVDGPYANWQGTELIYATLGGATGYTFTRDDLPVYGYGDRFQYLAGMYLYQSLCACLLQADLTGQTTGISASPRVRVSNFESVVSLLPYLTTQYEYNGAESTKEQSGPRFVNQCTDGFVVVYAGSSWAPIARALDRIDLLEDPRFVDNGARFENMVALEKILDEWASTKTVADACRAGEHHNVAITAIRSPEAALDEASLDQRGAWYGFDMNGRRARVPTMPYTVDGRRPHVTEQVSIA